MKRTDIQNGEPKQHEPGMKPSRLCNSITCSTDDTHMLSKKFTSNHDDNVAMK